MNNSSRILIIILCTLASYTTTYFFLQHYQIQNPVPPRIASIRTDITGDTTLYLKVERVKSIVADTTAAAVEIPVIGPDEILFQRNPSFLVWSNLIMIMMAIAGGACPVFIGVCIRLVKDFRIRPGKIAIAALCVCLIFLLLIVVPVSMKGVYRPDNLLTDFAILLKNGSFLTYIVNATFLLTVPILLSMFLLIPAADAAGDEDGQQALERRADNISFLNKTLMSALQVLAVIVVFSILTSGALRQSINATIRINGFDVFPKEFSYVYGLTFSMMLAAIYLPIQLFLKQRSADFMEALNNYHYTHEKADDKWYLRMKERGNIANSAFDSLKLSLTVLAPLISSFLPEGFRL